MKWGHKILLALVFIFIAGPAYAVDNFEHAKILAQRIYTGPLAVDIYCGCKYDPKTKKVDFSSCGYKPHFLKRAMRMEWEHVVPAYYYTSQLTSCSTRKACKRSSPLFRKFEGDLHNLRPAVGELNMIRSNKPYGLVRPKIKKYGACDFYSNHDFAEPPDNVKGDVARITLYMAQKYRMNLPVATMMLMKKWNELDPVSQQEKVLNRIIQGIQGDANPYVGL